MSANAEPPPEAGAVARVRQAAVRHRVRQRWVLGACLLAAATVGLAAWGLQRPENRDEGSLGFAMTLAASTFAMGCLFGRFAFPRPQAFCPRCGCDWYAESDNDMDTWMQWQYCPLCGLPVKESHDRPE
jgi:hypothetical protein